MNLIKKIFGFKELIDSSEKIQSEISKIKSQFIKNEKLLIKQSKNNAELIEKTKTLNSKVSSVQSKYTNIEKSINEVSDINKLQQNENQELRTELIKISELLKPKKSIPSNFSIIDPISNDNLFSFEKLSNKYEITNKKLLDNKPNRILQAIGNIPEFISGGLLSQSFMFKYPQGVIGDIMSIGSGQGTAIMSGGKILAHGTYVSNLLVSVPLLAYSTANMIIKQHYLAKINVNLKEINKKLDTLIDIEFIKKEAKIEAMIVFFKKAYSQFDLVKDNENYNNSILSNIISKNIKVFELIHFYKNSIETIEKSDKDRFKKSIQYFLALQELFVFGKILEFKYANEYNKTIIDNLINEFSEIQNDYFKFFLKNEGELHNLGNSINIKWFDKWYFMRQRQKNKKTKKKDSINSNRDFVNELLLENKYIFEQNSILLNDFSVNIEKPQEFLIENGKLYEIEM